MAAEPSIDALGQFRLATGFGPVGHSVNFTNSNEIMLAGGAIVLALLYFGMRPRAIIPGRLQSLAELSYQFLYSMCIDQIGPEGKRFFPFVFTLFFFVLMGNLIGLFPYFFTYTSHIAITGALALMVIIIVTVVALATHKLHFFTYFFPAGAPKLLAPLIIPVEIISYLSRPVSLSIRLFANMVAGHVLLAVLIGLIASIPGLLQLGLGLPIAGLDLGIQLLEIFVAFLQAYIFTFLTTLFLASAVAPSH